MNKKLIISIILLAVVVVVSFSGMFLWNQLKTDTASAVVDTTPTQEQESQSEQNTQGEQNTTSEQDAQNEQEKPEDVTESVDPSTLLRHAPNMYVQWLSDNYEFEAVTIDWKCTEDAVDTYWAVHNWSYGYAGFQNFWGQHVLLFSLWDLPDGTRPTIEFVLNGHSGNFGGEGEGKQVYTTYDWKVDTWYSMKVERLYENGKTYFTQFIREGNGEWLKTASISYPIEADLLIPTYVFQEDFGFNNYRRSCEVKNAGGLVADTNTWEIWTKCDITNSFFPNSEATWENGVMENISFDCDYKDKGESVWIQSGGYDDTPNNKTYPKTVTLNKQKVDT